MAGFVCLYFFFYFFFYFVLIGYNIPRSRGLSSSNFCSFGCLCSMQSKLELVDLCEAYVSMAVNYYSLQVLVLKNSFSF